MNNAAHKIQVPADRADSQVIALPIYCKLLCHDVFHDVEPVSDLVKVMKHAFEKATDNGSIKISES